ncbi:MAG: hypothetical protein IIC99_12210 [Chloroflexi bacterium]|nr:hypothetical protein [Chloroflexota bacterium]
MITEIPEQALTELSIVTEIEPDAIGGWLLEKLASERGWEKLFSESSDRLWDLAKDALTEHSGSGTKWLDHLVSR